MIRLVSGCKINIGLHVAGRLPDGYHELETLFYPLAWPADELRLAPTGRHEIRILCKDPALAGPKNILARAWRALEARTGRCPGLDLTLVKRVPAGAGLGGGSANAAALLLWLNRSLCLPQEELAEIAARLGADVPFFLVNRPCLARGIGHRLKPVPFEGQGQHLVLVWPGIHIDTAWAFRAWDNENLLTKPCAAARNSNSVGARPQYLNDLEQPVFACHPGLAEIKATLLDLGARSASMSGSGSSIFGIFAESKNAARAAGILRRKWPRVYTQELRNFGM